MTHKLSAQPLLGHEAIRARVGELGQAIMRDHAGKDLLVIGLMNGVFIFLADLVREFGQPVDIAFLKASSYGKSARSSGNVHLEGLEKISLDGRDVLLVDDILDTGRTLSTVTDLLYKSGAASVQTCVLLDKRARHEVPFEAHYVGLVIEDLFVVGYGLDFAEKVRNLADVWVVETTPPHS